MALSLGLFIVPLSDCEFGPPRGEVPPPNWPPSTLPEPPRECLGGPTPDTSLIPNGDFNNGWIDFDNPGSPAVVALPGQAPPPWQVNGTPDFSTDEEISFDSPGIARDSLPGFDSSPAGGSFLGFRSLPSSEEGIFNNLTILDPTTEITIFFYYTEYTAPGEDSGPAPDVNIEFRFNVSPVGLPGGSPDTTGIPVGDVPSLADTGGVAGTWEERRITFTPADLGVSLPGSYPFYLGAKRSAVNTWAFLDGLVVNVTSELCPPRPTPPPVPVPPVDDGCTLSTASSLMANGDFNLYYVDPSLAGLPGLFARRDFAPSPWRANGTPDFSTEAFVSLDDGGPPRFFYPWLEASPNGGSFMGFRNPGGDRDEGVVGYLPIDDPAEEITMVFEYTEYPRGVQLTQPAPDPSVGFQIRIGVDLPGLQPGRSDTTGVVVADVDNLARSGGTPGTWEWRRVTFTPSDLGIAGPGPVLVYLGAKDSARSTWAFIDGLVVKTSKSFC